MNLRIRALATEAEFSKKDLHIQSDNFQKFAELIVRECADIADINQHQWDAAGNYVKQHFGVAD